MYTGKSLDKLVGFCAYDMVTILNASVNDIIIATANVRPMNLVCILIANNHKNVFYINSEIGNMYLEIS